MIEQWLVKFHIGSYHDEVLCDIMPMDACHILLGRLWKYDRKSIHDGRKNTYTITKNGKRITLIPLEDDPKIEMCGNARIFLVDGIFFLES